MARLIQLICLGILILISISLASASETTISIDDYSVEPQSIIFLRSFIKDQGA